MPRTSGSTHGQQESERSAGCSAKCDQTDGAFDAPAATALRAARIVTGSDRGGRRQTSTTAAGSDAVACRVADGRARQGLPPTIDGIAVLANHRASAGGRLQRNAARGVHCSRSRARQRLAQPGAARRDAQRPKAGGTAPSRRPRSMLPLRFLGFLSRWARGPGPGEWPRCRGAGGRSPGGVALSLRDARRSIGSGGRSPLAPQHGL